MYLQYHVYLQYHTIPYACHIMHILPQHTISYILYHIMPIFNTTIPGYQADFFWTTSRLINGLFHTIHNIPYTNIQYTFNPTPYHTLNTIIIITVAVVIIVIIIVIIILTIGTVRLLDVNRERGLVWRPREDHSPYFPFYHHRHHHLYCLFCLHHNHDMDFSRQKCKKLIIKLFYLCLARIFLFLFSGQDFMISC